MDVDSEVGDASCGGSSQSKEAEEFSNVEVGSKVVVGTDTDNVERTNTEKREGDGVNNPEPSVGSGGEGGVTCDMVSGLLLVERAVSLLFFLLFLHR